MEAAGLKHFYFLWIEDTWKNVVSWNGEIIFASSLFFIIYKEMFDLFENLVKFELTFGTTKQWRKVQLAKYKAM